MLILWRNAGIGVLPLGLPLQILLGHHLDHCCPLSKRWARALGLGSAGNLMVWSWYIVGDVSIGGGLNKIMCVTVDCSWGLRNEIQTSDKTHWWSKSTRKHQLMKKDDFIRFGVWLMGGGVEQGSVAEDGGEGGESEAAGAGAFTWWNWSRTIWKNPGSGLLASLSYCSIFLGEKISWLSSSKYSVEMFISVIVCWY